MAAHDGVAALLAAPLLRELSARAPAAGLRIHTVSNERLLDQIAQGGVDVAIVPPILAFDGLRGEALAPTEFSVVCRRGHSTIKKRLGLARYCEVPHLMLTVTGDGPAFVDHLLRERGRSRRIAARVPYLLAAAEMVACSDLVVTVPTAIAEFFCELWPLQKFPFPLPLDPQPIFLCWHPRFDADPPHAFFREVVRTAGQFVARRGGPSFDHSPSLGAGRKRSH